LGVNIPTIIRNIFLRKFKGLIESNISLNGLEVSLVKTLNAHGNQYNTLKILQIGVFLLDLK